LRDAAEKAGVVFQVGRKIRQVVGDADRATGVRDDDGNSFCADAVMLAVGPSEAAELIPSAWNAQVRRFSERAKPVKAACLDLALRRLPKPDRTFVLGLDAPLYFSVHSGIARPGPPGGSMIHAAFYQPCGSEAADAREQLERMLDNVQPGWREQQIYSRFLPNVTVASALDSSNDGGKNGRPSERALARHGLYLAGDWVGAEGMLADASVASAVAAADAVLSEVPSQINSGTIYA
jgi:phytoene dehydrogenase-like protein